jgi:hypothetical protein
MEGDLKKQIITNAVKVCVKLLISVMNDLEIPNFIETTVIDEKTKEKYKLRIEKI